MPGSAALHCVGHGETEYTWRYPAESDADDICMAGTDALVNAILVSRGDALPTEFAAEKLEINPRLPFMGSSAYHVRPCSTSRMHGDGVKKQQ